MTFECHITFEAAAASQAQALADFRGWKTSQIERDPLLGDKSFFYLTKHSHSYAQLFADMEQTAKIAREAMVPFPPLRLKIEQILYDTKTGVGV